MSSTDFEEGIISKLDNMGDPRLAQCKSAVTQIEAALHSHPHAWQNYLQSARSIVTAVSSMQSLPTGDWAYFVTVLQDLGFADADNGSVTDITNWCQTQWLAILEKKPNSTAALRGKSFLVVLQMGF
ncbi:hypothetical protein SLS55_008043 [Diplodia seriata]|uniref:Uncharacterized protein n=1 Tax=Diplodia seriata TaxID=420778 RepID=A0ABR3C9D5_9PEZI